MSLDSQQFEFGDFLLDSREQVLFRNSKPLSLTPKAFQLLLKLVENHGHVLDKDELLRSVWAGSFVEEGNISFNIRQLRKILDDDAHNPLFIETIPRRGYRFIAEVREPGSLSPHPADIEQKISVNNPNSDFTSRKNVLFVLAAAILVIGFGATGFWFLARNFSDSQTYLLSELFVAEKLSTTGKVLSAVQSKDGKIVVYVRTEESGLQSVWIRQLDSGSNVEIIAPSENVYFGVTLSPEGNVLFFSKRPMGVEGQADIYRVANFGGIPKRIVDDAQGWMSISPDGTTISFVRCYYKDNDYCSLWIADAADGRNQRKVVSRPSPFRISANEISPDGKTIAYATGHSKNQANEFALMEVDIATGIERRLTKEKFFNIRSVAWLPDNKGILLTASRIPVRQFRIWNLDFSSGDLRPMTKDSESYSALSLSKDGTKLVSTQVKEDFRVFLLNRGLTSYKKTLVDANTVSFSSNDTVLFSSTMSGFDEIWRINVDGSGQQQLTNDEADDRNPIISPDGNTIYFSSNRTGEAQVWRMNTDGTDLLQVTKVDGGIPLFVTKDGKWIYYHHGIQRTLWRHSIVTGEAKVVLNKRSNRFAVSPDGTKAAFEGGPGSENLIFVESLSDLHSGQNINIGPANIRLQGLAWLSDGNSLAYIIAEKDIQGNSLWYRRLDGSQPKMIAELGDDEVLESYGFAVSPDGETFAVTQGGWRHDAILIKGFN